MTVFAMLLSMAYGLLVGHISLNSFTDTSGAVFFRTLMVFVQYLAEPPSPLCASDDSVRRPLAQDTLTSLSQSQSTEIY
jgi:hypothetical protein